MISVQMQADDDLRTMMQHSGIKSGALADIDTGEPTSKSYVQLAHYHMKAGRLDPGLYYLEVALSMDPDSIVIHSQKVSLILKPCIIHYLMRDDAM